LDTALAFVRPSVYTATMAAVLIATMPPDTLPRRDFLAAGAVTCAVLALDRRLRDFTGLQPTSIGSSEIYSSGPSIDCSALSVRSVDRRSWGRDELDDAVSLLS
jgi:hypothetical protein